MFLRNNFSALFAVAAAALALSGCAQSTGAATPDVKASSASLPAQSLTITDPWVKTADSGMSAAFGTLSNNTDHDVTVVSASTPASSMVELHETVMGASGTMQMQAKDGGFVIPAESELVLEPGGNHIMLMGLSAPVKAGDDIAFDLKLGDGSDVSFSAQGKDFSGANETYVGGEEPTGGGPVKHGGMDHGAASVSPSPSTLK